MTDLRKAAEMLMKALDDGWVERGDSVVIALRQALAQEQNKCPRCGEVNPAEIHTCSPQVAQEPVAWITPDGEGFRMRLEPPVNDVPLGWKALYAAPPKPWVGLTDDEMKQTCYEAWSFDPYVIAQAIQEKLRSKNEH